VPYVSPQREPRIRQPEGSPSDHLEALATEVAACRQCPRLVAWREQVAEEKRAAYADWDYWGRGVPAFGDPAAPIGVIGLAPAAHGANRTGRMFTGDRSGDWLYGALYRAGLANQPESASVDDGMQLRGVLITSPVKCAPPANKPTTQERDRCRPFLERELEVLNPRVLVVLGGFAYQVIASMYNLRPRPKFGHGVEVAVPDTNITIVCSYHVSQQNTFTGRLTEEMLDRVFTRAKELAGL